MKTTFRTIFVTSCWHFLRLVIFFFFFFLIFQNQSVAGDVIQQIKKESLIGCERFSGIRAYSL